MRIDARANDACRKIEITPDFAPNADGSVLIACGNTRVICTAVFVPGVPSFKIGSGEGWLTAEYAMLPASTPGRKSRETLRPDGRSVEIRRLIGRCMRAAVDLKALGENTLYLDCDVVQADGGTRTTSITGSFIAAALACDALLSRGAIEHAFIRDALAAISVGICQGEPLLDLCYEEDSHAQVDMNVVMLGGEYVEVQGTAEHGVFSPLQLQQMLDLAAKGIGEIMQIQCEMLRGKTYLIQEGVHAR